MIVFLHCTANTGDPDVSNLSNRGMPTPSQRSRKWLCSGRQDDGPVLPVATRLRSADQNPSTKSDPQNPEKFILIATPSVVKKTKEKSTPLPDPFPLPTNFRPDVQLSLSSKRMCETTRASFFSTIAAAVFQYKRYPTCDDYVTVARQIVMKYPFLGTKGFGAAHVRDKLHRKLLECMH